MTYYQNTTIYPVRVWRAGGNQEPQRSLEKLKEYELIADSLAELAKQAIGDREDLIQELLTSFRREKVLTLALDAERESKATLTAVIKTQEIELLARKFEVEELNQEIANLKAQLAAKITPPTNAPVPAQPAAGEAIIQRGWNDEHTLAVLRAYAKLVTPSELADCAGLVLKDLLQVEPTKRSTEWMKIQMAVNNNGGSGGLPPGRFGLTGKAQEAVIKVGH